MPKTNTFIDEPKSTKEIKVSQAELERRRKAVRDAMKAKGLDVLLLTVTGNIRWLTNTVPSAGGGQLPPNAGVDLQGYVEWNGSDAFFIRNYSGSSQTAGYFQVQCAGHN